MTGFSKKVGRATIVGVLLFSLLVSRFGMIEANARTLLLKGELNYDVIQSRKNQPIRVVASPGGTGAAAMALGRANRLVIDGACNSACAWAFVVNKDACFTSRATFGFHAAHDPGTGVRLRGATDYWLSQTPASLRSRLASLRSSSRVIRMNAVSMRQHFANKAC